MVEKVLTKAFDRLGADIKIVDVNPAYQLDALFAAPANTTMYEWKRGGSWPEFLMPRGGIYISRSTIQIVLTTSRSQPVRITQMTPVLTEGGCTAPLIRGWGYIDQRPQGASSALRFVTLIDDPNPTLARDGMDDSGASIEQHDYFGNGGMIDLVSNELTVIQVENYVNYGFCRFRFRVEYVAPGGPGTMTIDDHGKPFAITSRSLAPPAPNGYLPGGYDWYILNDVELCVSYNGRPVKLTATQVQEFYRRDVAGQRQYCAEVGVK
ncbi:hypothetical protein [Nocardia carnea]|uniref:hypothetical protein n=1 Tax=Nocardia carnea TaxID=37328 RepID=UPI0024590E78|nr:hypothetical protein [Nocardia carnea]